MLLKLTQAGIDAMQAEHIELTNLQIRILCYCQSSITPLDLRAQINTHAIYVGITSRYFVSYLDAMIHKSYLEVIDDDAPATEPPSRHEFIGKKSGNIIKRRS
jgi:hypothetical protein